MSVVCIIPARGGSKGIPKKNIRDFEGFPLIAWTIVQAIHSSVFTKIIVDTDDKEIAAIAEKFGAEVPYIRPKFLCGDTISSEAVILNSIKTLEEQLNYVPDTVVMLQATSPIRSKTTIPGAYNKFLLSGADSLSVVTEGSHFLWRDSKTPRPMFDINKRQRRQDMVSSDLIFEEHGSMYIFDKKGFQSSKCRLFGNSQIFVADRWEAIDIDNEDDWLFAEMVSKEHGKTIEDAKGSLQRGIEVVVEIVR